MMILITGANRGIGKYLYESLRIADNEVYGTYYSTIPLVGDNNLSKVDITSREDINNWINTLNLKNKRIVLINAAGILMQGFAHKVDLDNWNKVIEVNLNGTMNVIRSILPFMRDNNYGRIINFSSVVASKGVAGTSAYAASKSGLVGLTKAIAIENAIRGITINCISPGYFNVGMGINFSKELLEKITESIPMKKLGDIEDILKAVKFIIECNYMTGNTINVNGGLY